MSGGRPARRARAARLAGLAVMATGCDYLRDTARQRLANGRWTACAAGTHGVQLQRVDPDGRIRFTYVTLDERNPVYSSPWASR